MHSWGKGGALKLIAIMLFNVCERFSFRVVDASNEENRAFHEGIKHIVEEVVFRITITFVVSWNFLLQGRR